MLWEIKRKGEKIWKRTLLLIAITLLIIIVAVILIVVFKSNKIDLETSEYLIENDWQEDSYYSERGYYLENNEIPVKYVISMGEQSSGGYSIKITKVKIDEKNNVTVTVKESSSKRG